VRDTQTGCCAKISALAFDAYDTLSNRLESLWIAVLDGLNNCRP
jgi:hypothetical protein